MRIDAGFAEEILSAARSRGADQAEVYIRSSRNLSVEVKNKSVDALKSSLSFGYSLRVFAGKRLGFSYASETSDADAVIGKALESARSSDEDTFSGLPEMGGMSSVDIYDPALVSFPENEAIRSVMRIEDAALKEDKRIGKTRKVSGSFTSSETLIVNSESVRANYPSTSCSAQITVIAENGSDSQVGWDYLGSRYLADVSFEEVGRTASRKALSLLDARKMAGQRASVLLDSSVAVELLEILAASFSAEAVQKGRSLLAGRMDTEIVSRKIHIIDSGIIHRKLGSSPVDAEGVETREKVLIRDGVLKGYLHNTYTARKMNTISTGNAVRSGFSSLPHVGVSNFVLQPSSPLHMVSGDRLLSALGRGLRVVDAMGVHTANPISGDFSIGVTGLWVEGGAVCYPVKEAVISGNILALFSKIDAIGDDLRFYGNVGAPSLIISDMDISG